MIEPGIYRHFKGGEYHVMGMARHSETEEMLVVYFPLYGDQQWFVRPLTMFTQSVDVDGEPQPRFIKISDLPKASI
ncbi:MAG: DUF1653 domain-containing protein [Gammaproteobacteria bacterium]|nr:DUF1653 domain-containing protein [Gammaproteobacteria bacterium]